MRVGELYEVLQYLVDSGSVGRESEVTVHIGTADARLATTVTGLSVARDMNGMEVLAVRASNNLRQETPDRVAVAPYGIHIGQIRDNDQAELEGWAKDIQPPADEEPTIKFKTERPPFTGELPETD